MRPDENARSKLFRPNGRTKSTLAICSTCTTSKRRQRLQAYRKFGTFSRIT
jgi:hypothetical protein